ncbi:hypothetical protein [Microcoleus sp. F4-D5]|uniref:hypothetical protein n=1 Tax=Microcoleus sp. F4-D5 TaxID=2818760 RepID=UPI002FD53E08
MNYFGITQLLSGTRSYADEDFEVDRARMTGPEIESLAVCLILGLGANLKGSAIACYLNILRKANSPIVGNDRHSGAMSEFYRMLSIMRSRVLSTARMRTIGGGLCVGLFRGVCLKL